MKVVFKVINIHYIILECKNCSGVGTMIIPVVIIYTFKNHNISRRLYIITMIRKLIE